MMTTNNPIILKGIKPTKALVCLQKNAEKCIPNELDFIKSNKNSFGDDIGSITNIVTSMYSVQAKQDITEEGWKELDYRIKCGQNFQQNAIDKAKGIVSKPMPKEWYSYKPNKVNEEDSEEVKLHKELNLSIMADKKPYFFNYVYPSLMTQYKKYISDEQKKCLRLFRQKVEDLKCKPYKTEEEKMFLFYHELRLPSEISPCIMNKITWIFENEFDRYFIKHSFEPFDYSILKCPDKEYTGATYKKVEKIYKEYMVELRTFEKNKEKIKLTREEKANTRDMFKFKFKEQCMDVCSNEQELCNIVIDICYKKEGTKQFAWDVCGETIIDNLLKRNNYTVSYPMLDEDGDIIFKGFNFKMKDVIIRSGGC